MRIAEGRAPTQSKAYYLGFRLSVLLLLLAALFGCGGGGSATSSPPLPPPPPPQPSVAFTAPTAGLTVSGPSVVLTVQVTNPPANATVQFKVDGNNAGQPVNVFSGSASLTWDSTTVGNGQHSFTAQLVGTSASAQVSVTVNNQQALNITSILQPSTGWPTAYCRYACVRPFVITGAGFAVGQTISASNGVLFAEAQISTTQWNLSLKWDGLSYDPGFSVITITDSASGKSVSRAVAFRGNLPTMACSDTECFLNDQLKGMVYRWDIATSTKVGEFQIGRLDPGIAFDNQTGLLVISAFNTSVPAFDPTSGATPKSATMNTSTMGVAAKEGFACVAEDIVSVGTVECTDLAQTLPLPIYTASVASVGDIHHPIAMGKLGSQLIAASMSTEDQVFHVINVPQMTERARTTTGLRKTSVLATLGEGGFQLAMLCTPTTCIACYLHEPDKTLVFFNADIGGPEIGRLTFGANEFPFRVMADNTHGTFVVALADVANQQTTFVALTPGPIPTKTALNATVSFLATGLEVSADGTKLYLSNRDHFNVVNNN